MKTYRVIHKHEGKSDSHVFASQVKTYNNLITQEMIVEFYDDDGRCVGIFSMENIVGFAAVTMLKEEDRQPDTLDQVEAELEAAEGQDEFDPPWEEAEG